jgi:hypothetical protein
MLVLVGESGVEEKEQRQSSELQKMRKPKTPS